MSKGFEPDLRILFLRHGQAQANAIGAFLGRQDDPLTALGQKQAQALASRLDDVHFDAIYTSPLQRAAHTARAVTANKSLQPVTCQALVEQDFGDWDGHAISEVLKTTPDLFATWSQSGPDIRPPGGESLQEVADRIYPWYQDLKRDLKTGTTVGIVGHGGSLQALICKIMGMPLRPLWPFKLALASISEITYAHNQPSLIRLSA